MGCALTHYKIRLGVDLPACNHLLSSDVDNICCWGLQQPLGPINCYNRPPYPYSRVERFFTFYDFRNIAADQIYFDEFNSKKMANLATHAAKFLFFLNHRNLKINIYWENLKTFLLFQRTIAKKKKFNFKNIIKCLGPKMSKIVLTWTKENQI